MRLAAPTVLTDAVIGAGRGTLSRLIHIDLRAMAARIAAIAGGDPDAPVPGVAAGLVRWAALFVRNFELTLYWGVAWALAHIGVLVLGEAFWPHTGTPTRVSLPFDVIPGGMFLVSILRLATCMARVRQIHALTPPNRPGAPRLVNPTPIPWRLRLLWPTDLDLLGPLVVVAVLEVVAR
ncbi:MAG: hypothetical protein M3010_06780 [Candidatus Dormibacteraeota bacterium]|nr:hypothetical protein [Candidatus Dormibacteraeota bacterium]